MAAANDLVLYLKLAPEFGGTRFGPFEGVEARLGSDGDRCHITLPANLGVAAEHCKVMRQGGASLILAPSERTAAVWLWKGDARRPVQVHTPVAVRPGDSFSLVTPEGARFIVELAPLPPEVQKQRDAQRSKRGRRGLSAEGLANAGKDLALARLYTVGPVQMFMRAWHFVASGAILQPRILLLLMLGAAGYLGMGGAGCAALSYRARGASLQQRYDECNEQLGAVKDGGKPLASYTYADLAASITAIPRLVAAIQDDSDLEAAFVAKARAISEDGEAYAWMLDNSARGAEWATWRERVGKADGIDPETRKLLPFVAAMRDRKKGEWDRVLDSGEKESCARGPARLTYRQARSLGMTAVQPDAFVSGDSTALATDDAQRGTLIGQAYAAALETPPNPLPASGLDVITAGFQSCVRADGEDDRTDTGKVIKTLVEQIGRSGKNLPDAEGKGAMLARIAKLYAADLPGSRFHTPKESPILFKKTVSGALADIPGSKWVVERTAEVLARAVMLPCSGVLGDPQKAEAVFGTLPDPINCLVINYKLTH